MSVLEKFCVICKCSTNVKINLFVEKTLEKCHNISKIRIANNLKYNGVRLPLEPDETSGYHVKCYKSFTAIMQKYLQCQETEDSESKNSPEEIKAMIGLPVSSNDSNLKQISKACIFCRMNRKILKGKIQKLDQTDVSKLTSFLDKANNENLLKRIEDSASSTVLYHVICKSTFHYQRERAGKSTEENSYHTFRRNHKEAYEELCEYIRLEVINNRKSVLLSTMFSIFKYHLNEICNGSFGNDKDSFSEQHLEDKIRHSFNKEINIVALHKKKSLFLPLD